jgi:hypothetical protein
MEQDLIARIQFPFPSEKGGGQFEVVLARGRAPLLAHLRGAPLGLVTPHEDQDAGSNSSGNLIQPLIWRRVIAGNNGLATIVRHERRHFLSRHVHTVL